jgi:hypothetical protein
MTLNVRMNVPEITEQLDTLDSYHAWQEAAEAERTAAAARPRPLDVDDRGHLQSQLSYLDARQAQVDARSALRCELAAQDDRLMPVAYRLGLLAAFEMSDDGLQSTSNPMRPDRSEQPVSPSSRPINRALQIGDEVLRVHRLLDADGPVPVAMVWNHRFPHPRVGYDEVVLGEVADPARAFVIEEPQVVKTAGGLTVVAGIPDKLSGVEKGEVIRGPDYLAPDGRYRDPRLPVLRKLLGRQVGAHAVYIGPEEVERRVAQSREDERTAERHRRIAAMARRRSRHIHY